MNKNRMTLITILTAVLVMAFSTQICNAGGHVASGECGDNARWRLYPGGSLEIIGSGEMYTSPASFEDIRDDIISVYIETGVTSIGSLNFLKCKNLEKVTLPDSITSIGDGAFKECSSLTDVYYAGSEEEWKAVNIESNNYALENTEICFGKVTIPTGSTLAYNGKEQTGIYENVQYSAIGNTATDAGTYQAVLSLKDNTRCIWLDGTTEDKTVEWTINKASNPLKLKPKTAIAKYSKLRKNAQKLSVTKVIKFTKNAKDEKNYTLSSAKKGKKSYKKYFKINNTTGKVTVRKGLKRGTYKVKVKVKALGNSNYEASAVKAVTFRIRVK